jgi:hypothetical protein
MVRDDSASERVNIVLNWLDELKRLAPTKKPRLATTRAFDVVIQALKKNYFSLVAQRLAMFPARH